MITIIIQGLLNDISLSNIDVYREFGDVVLGVYSTDLDKLDKQYNCKVVSIPFPPPDGTNHHNIYYQAWSSYHAINQVRTPFVIKVRSDEKFTDLSPVIAKLKQYPDKLITSNVGFVACKYVPYHPSDHLIACKTHILKQTFKNIIDICQQNKHWSSSCHLNSNMFGLSTNNTFGSEESIFFSYLVTKCGLEYTNRFLLKMNPSDLMKQETDVIPFDDLGDIISSNSSDGKREYRNKEELQCIYNTGPGCMPCIKNIEEV